MIYALEFAALGADDDDKVAAGDEEQLASGDPDFYFFHAVAQAKEWIAEHALGAAAPSVPMWMAALACSEAFVLDGTFDSSDWYLVDRMLHPQTAGYLLAEARTENFGQQDGAPTTWTTVMHFAHCLGKHARAHRAANPDPYTIYEEDALQIPNAPFVGPLTALNK